jgi:hypothetical protein
VHCNNEKKKNGKKIERWRGGFLKSGFHESYLGANDLEEVPALELLLGLADEIGVFTSRVVSSVGGL